VWHHNKPKTKNHFGASSAAGLAPDGIIGAPLASLLAQGGPENPSAFRQFGFLM